MTAPRTAFCGGCLRLEPVDSHWRAMWVDSDGDIVVGDPLKECDLNYERPGTVLVCGQGSALTVMERYLATNSLESTLNLIPEQPAVNAYAELT